MNTSRVTRVEVIHYNGTDSVRAFVRTNAHVELQLQDDDRTLKVFVTDMEDPR